MASGSSPFAEVLKGTSSFPSSIGSTALAPRFSALMFIPSTRFGSGSTNPWATTRSGNKTSTAPMSHFLHSYLADPESDSDGDEDHPKAVVFGTPKEVHSRSSYPGGSKEGWTRKEDAKAIHLKVDMPGLSREDVKVCLKKDKLIVSGGSADKNDDQKSYTEVFVLPNIELLKLDEIKAEMKNGVLKMEVPKFQEEERKDVLFVTVD